MHAEHLVADGEGHGQRGEKRRIRSRKLGPGMLDACPRERIPANLQVALDHAALMVAGDDRPAQLARGIEALLRIRTVPDDVAEAHHHVDAAPPHVCDHAIEGDDVSVDVRDDGDASHGDWWVR